MLKIAKIPLRKILSLAGQFGIDLLRLAKSIRGLPCYVRDLNAFRSLYQGSLDLMPCLADRYEEAGYTTSEYFWQDLLVARWIHEAAPRKHVDVGSRVDGFVAHVASFRELEVLDIRPIKTKIQDIHFREINLMSPNHIDALMAEGKAQEGYCDSISCLHVLEHLGLGRYGDPIDPWGYELGLMNLAKLLEPRGILYLATPLGRERVEFNANRVFSPKRIFKLANQCGLVLDRFFTFNNVDLLKEIGLEDLDSVVEKLSVSEYNLGIMRFIKSEPECSL
jgi:hypothetical protein